MVVKSRRQTRKEARQYASAKTRAETHKSGDRTTYTVPDGVSLFSVKDEGVKRLRIAPFKAGKGNPFADPGMYHYERTIFVHFSVGPNNGAYVCPAKTNNKPCPICEWRSKEARKSDADTKAVDALRWKERQLFWVLDEDAADKGWQLWEIAHFNFGKLLDERIEKRPKFENFFHAEGGNLLEVTFSKESMKDADGKGSSFIKATAIDFEQGEDLEDIDDLPSLDDLILIEPYEKLKAVFLQVPGGDEEEEDEEETVIDENGEDIRVKKPGKKPARRGKPDPEDQEEDDEFEDDEDNDDLEEEEEEDDPPKKPVGKKPVKKPAAKKPPKDDEEEEDEWDEEEEEDEPPKKPAKKPASKKPPVEDDDDWEDDEDEDEEEEEEEAPRRTAKKPARKK